MEDIVGLYARTSTDPPQFCWIGQLPYEVLSHIFEIYFSEVCNDYYGEVRRLMGVCRYWREGIDTTRSLWGLVDNTQPLEWSAKCLSNSNPLPILDIAWSENDISNRNPSSAFVIDVIQHSHRCQSLHYTGTGTAPPTSLVVLLLAPTPNLRRVVIDASNDKGSDNSSVHLRFNAPLLEEVVVRDARVVVHSPGLVSGRLKKLVLDRPDTLTFNEVIHIIASNDRLDELSLSGPFSTLWSDGLWLKPGIHLGSLSLKNFHASQLWYILNLLPVGPSTRLFVDCFAHPALPGVHHKAMLHNVFQRLAPYLEASPAEKTTALIMCYVPTQSVAISVHGEEIKDFHFSLRQCNASFARVLAIMLQYFGPTIAGRNVHLWWKDDDCQEFEVLKLMTGMVCFDRIILDAIPGSVGFARYLQCLMAKFHLRKSHSLSDQNCVHPSGPIIKDRVKRYEFEQNAQTRYEDITSDALPTMKEEPNDLHATQWMGVFAAA